QGPGGAVVVFVVGNVERRGRAAEPRLPLLAQSPERGHLARAVPGRAGVLAPPPRGALPVARGDAARQRPVPPRRVRVAGRLRRGTRGGGGGYACAVAPAASMARRSPPEGPPPRRSGTGTGGGGGRLRLRRRSRGEHGPDLLVGESRFLENLHAVLAEPRLMASDAAGRGAVRGGEVRLAGGPLARMLEGFPEAGGLQLWIGEDRVERVHDGGGHVRRVEQREPLRIGAGGRDLSQLLVEQFDVGEARGQRAEARVGEQVLAAGHAEERLPVRVGVGGDGEGG